MATIGNVVISVFASTKGLSKSLASAQKNFKSFAKKAVKTLKNIGLAVGAGIAGAVASSIAIVNKYAITIDKLVKTSSKLGLFSVKDLQKLQYQAELTGVSADTMNMALQRMVRRVSEAAKGTGAAKDAIKELGLSAEKLNDLSPDKQFNAIAESMKGISNQGDKVRLAMKIFDTEGVSLVNTMNGNLRKMGAEFDSLGIGITGSAAKMVESYNDSKTKIGAIFSGFGLQLTAQLAEPFKIVLDHISEVIIKMGGMEVVANKVALGMVKALRGVVDVINGIIKGINQFEIISKKAELKGAEHRGVIEGTASKLSGGLIGDSTNNQSAINKIKKEIEDLEKPIKSLAKIDKFISEMEQKVLDSATSNSKIDLSDVIKPEHYKAFGDAANDANDMAKSSEKATDATIKLSSAASKAADSLSVLSGSSSRITQRNVAQVGGSSGLGDSLTSGTSTDKIIQKLRDNTPTTKITLNMVTDEGEVAGELLGNQEFINKLSRLQERRINSEARAATN